MATTAEPKDTLANLRALDAQASELLTQIRNTERQLRDANYTIGQRFGQRGQEDIYGIITRLTNLQEQYDTTQRNRSVAEREIEADRDKAERIAAQRRRVEEQKKEVLAELQRLERQVEEIYYDQYLRTEEKDSQTRGLTGRIAQAQDELQQLTNQEGRLEYDTETLRGSQARTVEAGTEAPHQDTKAELTSELVALQADHAARRAKEAGLTFKDIQIEESQARLQLLYKDEITALTDGNFAQARNIRMLRELEANRLTNIENPPREQPAYYDTPITPEVANLYRKEIEGYQFNGAAGRLTSEAYIRSVQQFDGNFAQAIVNQLGPEAVPAMIPEFTRAIDTYHKTREAEAQAAAAQAEQDRITQERQAEKRRQDQEEDIALRQRVQQRKQEQAALARQTQIDQVESAGRIEQSGAQQNAIAQQQQTAQDTETDFMAQAQDAAARLQALEQQVGTPVELPQPPIIDAQPEAAIPETRVSETSPLEPNPLPPIPTQDAPFDLTEPELEQVLATGGGGAEEPPVDTSIKLDVSTLSPAGELGLLADFSHFAKDQYDKNTNVSFDAICKLYAGQSDKATQFFGEPSQNQEEEQARLATIETYYANGLVDFANLTSPQEFLAHIDTITDALDKAQQLADQVEARQELSMLPQFDQLNQMREEMLKRGAGKGLQGLEYDQQVFATYLKNRANRIYAEKLVPDIVDHRKETVTHLLKDQLRQTLGVQTLPPEVGTAVDAWYNDIVAKGQVPSAANGRVFVDNLANPPQGIPDSRTPNYFEARRAIDAALASQNKTFTPTQEMSQALAGNIYTVPINGHIAGLATYQQTVTSLGSVAQKGLSRVAPLEGGISAGAQASGEAKSVEQKLLTALQDLHDHGNLAMNDTEYKALISRDQNGHLNKRLRDAAFRYRNQFAIYASDHTDGTASAKSFNEIAGLDLLHEFGDFIKGDKNQICERMAETIGYPKLVQELEKAKLYHTLVPAAMGDKQAQTAMVTYGQAVAESAQAEVKALERNPNTPMPTPEVIEPILEAQLVGEQCATTMTYLPRVVEDTVATNTLLEQERANKDPQAAPSQITYFQRYVAEHPKFQAETPQEQQADLAMAKMLDKNPTMILMAFDFAQLVVQQQYAASKGQVRQAQILAQIIKWYVTQQVKMPTQMIGNKLVAINTYKKEIQNRTKQFLRKYTPSFLHLDFVLSNKYMKVLWSAPLTQIPQKIALMVAKDLTKKAWRWAYGGSRLDPFSLINPNSKDPWGEYNKYMKDWEKFSGTKRYKFLRRPTERVQQLTRYGRYKTGEVAKLPFRKVGSFWSERFGGTAGKFTKPFKELGKRIANSAIGKGFKLTKKVVAKALIKIGAIIAKAFSTVLTVLSIWDLIQFLRKAWKRILKVLAFLGSLVYFFWLWLLKNLPMLIGGAIGGAIGGFLFGPIGALVGAAVGSFLANAFFNFLLPLFAKGGVLGSLIGGALGGYFGGFFGGVGGIYVGGAAEFIIRQYLWPKFGTPFQISFSGLLNGIGSAIKGMFDAITGLINWGTSAAFGGSATIIGGSAIAVAIVTTIISVIILIPETEQATNQPALKLEAPVRVENGLPISYTLSANIPKCTTSVTIENQLPPNTTVGDITVPAIKTGGLIKTIDAVANATRITWNLTITQLYCRGQSSQSPQPSGQARANTLGDTSLFESTIRGQGRNVAVFPSRDEFIAAVEAQASRFPSLQNQDDKLTMLYDKAIAQQVNPLAVLAIWGVEASYRTNNSEFGCKPFGNGFERQVTCSINTLDKWMSVFEQARLQPGFTGTVDLPSRTVAGKVCSFDDPFIFAYEKYSPVCVINDANENARKNFANFYNAFLGG